MRCGPCRRPIPSSTRSSSTSSPQDGALDYYDPAGAQIIARQQLTPVYHRNGIAYAITRECLTEQKTIKGKRTGALVISGHVVNIDTPFDLKVADFLFSEGLIS